MFHKTERHPFAAGLRPLSAVKDMIGSQASKGMHVLARFARSPVRCGVWSQGLWKKVSASRSRVHCI